MPAKMPVFVETRGCVRRQRTTALSEREDRPRTASQSPDDEAWRGRIQEVADSLRTRDVSVSGATRSRGWKPARTPWGDPDIASVYTNTDEHFTPFERPAEFEGRRLEDITPEELVRIQEARREATIEA